LLEKTPNETKDSGDDKTPEDPAARVKMYQWVIIIIIIIMAKVYLFRGVAHSNRFCVMLDWFPFFSQKATFWIHVMRSRSTFSNKIRHPYYRVRGGGGHRSFNCAH
jgi:hypothetical protein